MSSRSRRPPSGRNNLGSNRDDETPAGGGGGLGSARSAQPCSAREFTTAHTHTSPRIYADGRPPLVNSRSNNTTHLQYNNSARRPVTASPAPSTRQQRPQSSPIHSSRKAALFASPRQHQQPASSARSMASDSTEGCIILCSDRSDINTREVMQQLRNRHSDEELRRTQMETVLMSDYNPFSRPRPSSNIPLRSAFLDPETNNFFPSKTRSELLGRIKLASMPHPSYDIDGDGWVSQEDYKLAKRFDFDGNGVIDPHERKIAKSVITDEFFKNHRGHLHVFGDKIAQATHAENVNAVVNSKNFERTFGLLKGVEDSLKGRASKEMLGCMDTVHKHLTQHNFYTDKLDTSAWNDFDAVPRGRDSARDLQHCGSRRRLLDSRRVEARSAASQSQKRAADQVKTRSNHRIALISNYALEN